MNSDEPVRGTWVWQDGKLVPKHKAKKVVNAPFVHKDEVDAFENPLTGEMESSMSTYRKKLKEQGYEEKGNDRHFYELPKFKDRYEEIREAKMKAEQQIKYGMAPMTEEEREKWNN